MLTKKNYCPEKIDMFISLYPDNISNIFLLLINSYIGIVKLLVIFFFKLLCEFFN